MATLGCWVTFLLLQALPFVILKPRWRRQTTEEQQSCPSLVYCQGKLLETVQMARLFPDSKTFVDLSQVNDEKVTIANFESLMTRTNNNPSKEQVGQFVSDNFNNASELVDWTPPDFKNNPQFLNVIKDKEVRKFAADVIAIWPSLGRKTSVEVLSEPSKHSLIGVPNGFIIPGGRFRELYYHDSYWIVEGLLLSEMSDTARGMIENLLGMVEKYGFVPNGGRVYYLNRSQPPLLTLMAGIYFDQTQDIAWIKKNIPLLAKELTYWLDKKMVQVKTANSVHTMAHYISESTTPRPESFYEDVTTCGFFAAPEEKAHCYQGLKSGAESGWDFSSRWLFDEDGGVKTNLTHIDAQRVVPVDLNAFLHADFMRLSSFYKLLGDAENARKWLKEANALLVAIDEVLYDKADGIWYDFDLGMLKPRKIFFASNFAPLWALSYDLAKRNEYGNRAADYFTRLRLGRFKGGVPTSLEDNNEQWDLPNAWPPLQEFIVLGLWNTGNKKARRIARETAETWVEANMLGFQQQNAMFEKYDATNSGQYGGGGEYEVQKGFGWTNGVALNFIDKFYTRRNKRMYNKKHKF